MTHDTATDALPRVAHLLRPAQGGMRELVRTLLRAAEPVTPPLLIAPADVLESLSDAVEESRRHLLKAESSAPHHQLAAGQAAGRWAKRQDAAVIHGHGLRYAPLFAAASVSSGLPLVVTLHNLVPDEMNGLQKTAARTALTRASAVIAISEAVARSAAEIVPNPERLVTIANGIDLSRFRAPEAERHAARTSLRTALGIADDAPMIVCLSRLSPEKDVTNLVEAVTLLRTRYPDIHLVVAGEGRLRKTLEWHTELLGVQNHVTLLGAYSRERIPDLLYAADIFALSSREEGLSLAVLEAMAAGLPVVATEVGGLPEAIQKNETGLLVPPRDPARLAEAIATLLSNPTLRHTFGIAGRQRVQERFTDAAMIAKTFGVYRRMAHGR